MGMGGICEDMTNTSAMKIAVRAILSGAFEGVGLVVYFTLV